MEKYLLVVQQQHDGVELLAGAVVGPQRHDEIVEPVPGRLRGNDDQLVLEPVGFGVLKAVVFAALGVGQSRNSEFMLWGRAVQAQAAPRAPSHLVQPQAAERGFLRQEVAQGRGAADVGRVRGVALHVPAAQREIRVRTGGELSFIQSSGAGEKHSPATPANALQNSLAAAGNFPEYTYTYAYNIHIIYIYNIHIIYMHIIHIIYM